MTRLLLGPQDLCSYNRWQRWVLIDLRFSVSAGYLDLCPWSSQGGTYFFFSNLLPPLLGSEQGTVAWPPPLPQASPLPDDWPQHHGPSGGGPPPLCVCSAYGRTSSNGASPRDCRSLRPWRDRKGSFLGKQSPQIQVATPDPPIRKCYHLRCVGGGGSPGSGGLSGISLTLRCGRGDPGRHPTELGSQHNVPARTTRLSTREK